MVHPTLAPLSFTLTDRPSRRRRLDMSRTFIRSRNRRRRWRWWWWGRRRWHTRSVCMREVIQSIVLPFSLSVEPRNRSSASRPLLMLIPLPRSLPIHFHVVPMMLLLLLMRMMMVMMSSVVSRGSPSRARRVMIVSLSFPVQVVSHHIFTGITRRSRHVTRADSTSMLDSVGMKRMWTE